MICDWFLTRLALASTGASSTSKPMSMVPPDPARLSPDTSRYPVPAAPPLALVPPVVAPSGTTVSCRVPG